MSFRRDRPRPSEGRAVRAQERATPLPSCEHLRSDAREAAAAAELAGSVSTRSPTAPSGAQRYRPPTGWAEAVSPYRTYALNVLAQKVGVPAALAAIHVALLQRLTDAGLLRVPVEVVLPYG